MLSRLDRLAGIGLGCSLALTSLVYVTSALVVPPFGQPLGLQSMLASAAVLGILCPMVLLIRRLIVGGGLLDTCTLALSLSLPLYILIAVSFHHAPPSSFASPTRIALLMVLPTVIASVLGRCDGVSWGYQATLLGMGLLACYSSLAAQEAVLDSDGFPTGAFTAVGLDPIATGLMGAIVVAVCGSLFVVKAIQAYRPGGSLQDQRATYVACLIGLFVAGVVVLGSRSRQAALTVVILGLLLGIISFVHSKKRLALMILAADFIFLIMSLVTGRWGSAPVGRLILIESWLEAVSSDGVGARVAPGSFSSVYDEFRAGVEQPLPAIADESVPYPHNFEVQLLLEYGIFGLLLGVFFISAVAIVGLADTKRVPRFQVLGVLSVFLVFLIAAQFSFDIGQQSGLIISGTLVLSNRLISLGMSPAVITSVMLRFARSSTVSARDND